MKLFKWLKKKYYRLDPVYRWLDDTNEETIKSNYNQLGLTIEDRNHIESGGKIKVKVYDECYPNGIELEINRVDFDPHIIASSYKKNGDWYPIFRGAKVIKC